MPLYIQHLKPQVPAGGSGEVKGEPLVLHQHTNCKFSTLRDVFFAQHGLSSTLLPSYYSPVWGLMVGDEKIGGLNIHEQTQ